ncbi:hypothetical protein K439DRAFT_1611824 [Ramaria rubella]|nr:hypothetical protein K439DRAFT_1611824 [Ramaria rubella]
MVLPSLQKPSMEKPQADASDAVASPSDPENDDVVRKLRIYGMVQAFRRGRLPGNTQLDNALVVFRDMLTRRTESPESLPGGDDKDTFVPLSEEGRAVVLDIRDIVETTRQFIRQKNADEVAQDFIYHTFNTNVSASALGVELPVSVDEVREHKETGILIRNREARKLISDSKIILRDLFAQTAVAAAERTRPSAAEMDGIDYTAPAEDWAPFSNDGEEENQPGTAPAPGHTALEPNNLDHRDRVNSHRQARDEWVETEVADSANLTPSERTDRAANGVSPKTHFHLDLKSRFKTLAGRVPAHRRAHAEERLNHAKTYLNDEFPQERRDQFIWRLKKVVTECQSTPSYQASISWFLTVLQRYLSSAGALAKSRAAHTNDLFNGDPILARAVSELRTIAERGAGGRSLSDVQSALEVLWNDARGDEEMRDWWDRVDDFTLLQPGFITSTRFTSQAKKLRASGRFFFTDKYKAHTDTLLEAAQAWSRAWMDDPLHVRFADDWSKLVRDLLFDEQGGLVFKSLLWEDMRAVILPGVLRRIGVIPIPRIEYIDEDLDLVIENLTLQGANLFPKTIELMAKHYSKLTPFNAMAEKAKNEHRTEVTLKMSGIQADMRDVAFDYRRKSGVALGLGKIRDEGLADIFVGGRGITVKLKLANAGAGVDRDRDGKAIAKGVFEVKDVRVKVEGLKFTIRDSNHDFLYKAFRPLVTRLIKEQIVKVFSDGIRSSLGFFDEQLAAVRADMAKAKSSESISKRTLLKQFWHTQATHISRRKRDSAFRVVPKRDSALLPGQRHKRGWARRQAEKDAEIAAEGIGWRSEAFTMDSHHETMKMKS